MVPFLVTLAIVYGAGLVWNFVKSGGATWAFNWPLVLVKGWWDAWTLRNVK